MSSGTTSWHVVNRCKDDFKEFVDTLVVALRITEKADCSPPQMSFYRGNASPDTPWVAVSNQESQLKLAYWTLVAGAGFEPATSGL